MDPESIQTASQYVNNLLLARGLLRDGNAIDFAASAKGGQETTVANIINLIHDLVMRRDRESEHLSSLSQSLQTLRTDAAQHGQMVTRLENEKADLQRELQSAKSQARISKADGKSLETKNKAYKEDIQRLRTSVGQIRAQCANDVRKRDAEITRLKKHLDVQRTRESRNSGSGPGGVTIIDPTTGKAHYPASMLKEEKRSSNSGVSLQDETNEHLTALSAELSETNEALSSLVQSTISTLRTLQGLPAEIEPERAASNVSQRPPSNSSTANISAHEPVIQVAETPSLTSLADQLASTIASLRSLVTDPSFVPVEEVEARDAELLRLRAGWETMELRWREAVGLMNGWRQRMLGGEAAGTISMDDIQRGMELAEEGLSVAGSPEQRLRGRKRDSSGSEISLDTYADASSEVAETSVLSTGSDVPTEEISINADDVGETPRPKKLRFDSAAKPEASAGLFPAPQVLRPKSSNSRSPTRRQPSAHLPLENPVDATPTPAVRSEGSVPSTARADLMSPDIWMQPESEARSRHETRSQNVEEPQEAQFPQMEGSRPTKRTVLPRRMASKRRSTLTPAEMDGLVARQG